LITIDLKLSAFICGNPRSSAFLACAALAACLMSGCTVGPDYKKPEAAAPAQFKELGDWVIAKPADAQPKGKWWEAFNDPVLNGLEEQVAVSNQTLAAAEARYRQSQAAVQLARSSLFPSIGASANAGRGSRGGNGAANNYSVALDVQWEADLWGGIRRQVEAARANAEASQADLENARLSLQAQLASTYFLLRVADVQRDLLNDTVKAFQTSLDIANNRYRAGVVGKVDVVTAESQVRSAQADVIDLQATRAQLEHAIAALVGQPASTFSLAPVKFETRIPEIPPGVPSTLLERRPDVAGAERRVAAANARIGAAEAAYFPSLTLNGSGGFAGSSLGNLISAPNRVWSLGLGLAATLIDFGARSAQVESARATYDESVANYRQTVLTSFQEVEDNLATVRWLAQETEVQQEATRLARESVALTVNQYKAGTVGYANVLVLQAAQLNQERALVQLLGRRLSATVALIKALGGAW
jgi:NodT family efflux transporter outer membrane factor (OMF) lipoprotein